MYSLSEIDCKDSKIQLIMQTKGITISINGKDLSVKIIFISLRRVNCCIKELRLLKSVNSRPKIFKTIFIQF